MGGVLRWPVMVAVAGDGWGGVGGALRWRVTVAVTGDGWWGRRTVKGGG